MTARVLAGVIAAFAVYCGLFGQQWTFLATTEWSTLIETADSADLDHAWDTLVAFDRYADWNTFTSRVEFQPSAELPGVPVVGTGVKLNVVIGLPHPFALFAAAETKSELELDFTWLRWDPDEHTFCWGIRNPVVAAFLTSDRCCELRFAAGFGVLIRNTDTNVGIAAPLVGAMYRDAIELGFEQMNRDLARRLQKSPSPKKEFPTHQSN